MVEKYCGEAYRDDVTGDWSENHMYEYIRLTTGKVIFDNPRVRVKTRRPGSQKGVAKAIQHVLNRWVKDVALRRLLKRVYVSQSFAYEVVQTASEPQSWMDPRTASKVSWPMPYQLGAERYFFDPLCRWPGAARYSGHKFVRDKEDLIEEAEDQPGKGWNLDAIRQIAEGSGVEQLEDREDTAKENLNRKEIVAYEMWVPEVHTREPDEGFNGTIYTVAVGHGVRSNEEHAEFIREPRPFYGPRWGPYTLYGVYPVPNDPFPLSPFAATHAQQRELNDIVTAINKGVREYKRLVLCSAENPDMMKKLKSSPDMYVIPIKGFAKDQMEVVELGGITSQQMTQLTQALDRMDRNTGITETNRGNVGSGSTATEIAVSEQSSQDTISFVKQEFTDSTQQVLATGAWYAYHDDRFVAPLGEDALKDFPSMGEPWFAGGSHDEASDARFDDLELEIEPYSMERMNEALARAQYREMLELVMAAAPIIPASPFYDWRTLFDKGGEVLNDPSFGEFFDPELAGMIGGMQAGGGGGEGGPPGMGGISSAVGSAPGSGLPGNQTGARLAAAQGAV
jgi:hypothetical protein